MAHHCRKLVVPAFLAAVALGAAPSCKDDEGGGNDTSVSGENECYDILDMAACEAETAFACQWDEALGECLPNCGVYDDQSSCEDDGSCLWLGSSCEEGSI